MAYLFPCVRLMVTHFDATLGMGGWLDLTQQGLSSCKKYKTSWRSSSKSYRIIDLHNGFLSHFTCYLSYTVFIFNFSLKSDRLSSSQNSILRFSKGKESLLCHLINLILSLSISMFVMPFL